MRLRRSCWWSGHFHVRAHVSSAVVIEAVDPQGVAAISLLREAALEARRLYPEFLSPTAPMPTNRSPQEGSAYFVAFSAGVAVGCGFDGSTKWSQKCGECTFYPRTANWELPERFFCIWSEPQPPLTTLYFASKLVTVSARPLHCMSPSASPASLLSENMLATPRASAMRSASHRPVSPNMSIDTDPQLREAASPQVLVVRSSLR